MVKFDSREDNDDNEDGSSTLDSILDEALEIIRDDPEIQSAVMQMVQDQGIDPKIISSLVDEETDVPGDEIKDAQDSLEPNAPDSDDRDDLDPDYIIDLLDEIMQYTGGDMTLEELRDYAEDNRDLIKTAIDLKL